MTFNEVISTFSTLGFDINEGKVKYHKEGFGCVYKKGVFRVWSTEGLYCYPHEKLDKEYLIKECNKFIERVKKKEMKKRLKQLKTDFTS